MSLIGRLSNRQVAWRFGSPVDTYVFKVPELVITAEQDMREYRTASGTFNTDFIGLWLNFSVSTQYFKEQVSGTAVDRVDILNALNGTSEVLFYPIYEADNTVSYAVKSTDSNVRLLRTSRGLFTPEQTINMRAITRINQYPTWLNYK